MANNRSLGADYENVAAKYLEQKGYKILDRNYHAGKTGELDIVCMSPDNKILVIVECKYRESVLKGDPLEAVGNAKIRQICRVTLRYLNEKAISPDIQIRFDVIGMCGDGSIKHIENAFEYVGIM